MQICANTRICNYISLHIYLYTYTRVYVYIYAYIHTHTYFTTGQTAPVHIPITCAALDAIFTTGNRVHA
jgi:hypothetical protein